VASQYDLGRVVLLIRLLTWCSDFLSWNVWISGVVAIDREPPKHTFDNWGNLGKAVVEGRCSICGRRFWSWRELDMCGSFRCYRTFRRERRESG
jgi:hypothetical protein